MTSNREENGSRGARVPPHNLDAETAVIGAALISPAAVDAMLATVTPADFYRPGHQHIAAAIGELVGTDRPVDVVTVAEQLRRTGHLETLDDGAAYLHRLQNATPAISNAGHYARIVKDTAILRRLIGTAAAIADLGYRSTDDPGSAVAAAGELLSGMDAVDAASLSTLEIADIAALLESNLEPEEATILARSDGAALLYPAKMHVIQAEPTAGKGWVACYACAEVLRMGGAAIYIDLEDTPSGIVRRLLTLGLSADLVRERFAYIRPGGRFGPAERLDLFRAVDRLNPDLVVIDSVGEALSREGLSEDKADDIIRWTDALPRPLARTGAAVLMLDHVSKDPEQRGRWARGSGAKLGTIDGASYQVKVRVPFSRHRAGRLDIVVAKDRPGGVGAMGETVATMHVEPHAAGEHVTIRVEPHTVDQAPTDSWKPTILMTRVAHALAESTVPLTATALRSLVHSDHPRLVGEALSRLMAEGYVTEEGRPKRLHLVRPYEGNGATGRATAPPWREEPLELELELDGPTPDDVAEVDRARPTDYYNHPAY